ncbi:MAG: DUF2142 domain-containing protein, partial [Acidothermus sp.]|nr:DUF2142 domain-containing protein [Acidothermus sp.]
KYASPDEPAHAIKAAANARGEFRGTPHYTDQVPFVGFKVPATLLQGNPACVAFKPAESAACLPLWTTKPGTGEGLTYVGGYPPIYYVLVGVPSLLTTSPTMLLWMRLVSAALSALFLSVAFIMASRVRHARWTVLGVATAASPIVMFLAGMVNPNGFEISAAIALWCCLLALVTSPRERPNRSTVIWTTITAAVFVQVRSLSLLWAAVIGLTILALAGWSRSSALLSRRDVRIGLIAFGMCAEFVVLWILMMGGLEVQDSLRYVDPTASNFEVLRTALRNSLEIKQMIGILGWLDTYLPPWCYVAWETILIALAIGVLLRRDLRTIAVVLALAAAVIAIPTLLIYAKAREHGILGQGRDFLPIAVGVPILGAYAIARRNQFRALISTAAALIGGTIAAVQLAGFVQALHRYRTGVNAPILTYDAPWRPPISPLLAVAAFAVLQVAFLIWWMSLPHVTRRMDAGVSGCDVDAEHLAPAHG